MSAPARVAVEDWPRLFHGMVGRHRAMRELFASIERAAAMPAPVLVEGRTGVGKELVVQALHALSGSRGTLVTLNVTTLPEQLVESELFGVVRGAYTGAVADREGLFSAASGGTLYLDEAGDLPQAIQVRLLRALEAGRIRPVGSTREVVTSVRLVVSVQHPPATLVSEGRWRPDFYYRVAGIALRVPTLAERPSDLQLLADHFLARMGAAPLSPDGGIVLQRYGWPGNVRQLLRALERAAFQYGISGITAESVLQCARDLEVTDQQVERQRHLTLRELERRQIEAVLQEAPTTREAAAILGLSSHQLYRRLRAFGLRAPRGR